MKEKKEGIFREHLLWTRHFYSNYLKGRCSPHIRMKKMRLTDCPGLLKPQGAIMHVESI